MKRTSPKPFAFVLMPFESDFDDVYLLGIKPACETAGAYAERVDEQIFQESILERIYNQITKADLIISDMTGRNPNVFYETGYAHALGKRVILLTRDASDIPFDLKHYPHIVYGGRVSDLLGDLTKRVKWALENPESDLSKGSPGLRAYYRGTALDLNPMIGYYPNYEARRWNRFEVDINNEESATIQTVSFRVALMIDGRLDLAVKEGRYKSINLSGTRKLCVGTDKFNLFPGGWESVPFIFRTSGVPKAGETFDCELQVYSEADARRLPFKLKFLELTVEA